MADRLKREVKNSLQRIQRMFTEYKVEQPIQNELSDRYSKMIIDFVNNCEKELKDDIERLSLEADFKRIDQQMKNINVSYNTIIPFLPILSIENIQIHKQDLQQKKAFVNLLHGVLSSIEYEKRELLFYLTKRLKHECSVLGMADISSPLLSLTLHEQISNLTNSLTNLLQRKNTILLLIDDLKTEVKSRLTKWGFSSDVLDPFLKHSLTLHEQLTIVQPLATAPDHAFFTSAVNALKKLCNNALQKCHASGDEIDAYHELFDDSSIYQINRIEEIESYVKTVVNLLDECACNARSTMSPSFKKVDTACIDRFSQERIETLLTMPKDQFSCSDSVELSNLSECLTNRKLNRLRKLLYQRTYNIEQCSFSTDESSKDYFRELRKSDIDILELIDEPQSDTGNEVFLRLPQLSFICSVSSSNQYACLLKEIYTIDSIFQLFSVCWIMNTIHSVYSVMNGKLNDVNDRKTEYNKQ